MRLENELKGERMVTPSIETGPRIVHIDRGSKTSEQLAVIRDFRDRYVDTLFH